MPNFIEYNFNIRTSKSTPDICKFRYHQRISVSNLTAREIYSCAKNHRPIWYLIANYISSAGTWMRTVSFVFISNVLVVSIFLLVFVVCFTHVQRVSFDENVLATRRLSWPVKYVLLPFTYITERLDIAGVSYNSAERHIITWGNICYCLVGNNSQTVLAATMA